MKPIKIPAIVTESECPCGKGICRHYNRTVDFKEINSYLISCRPCSLKYRSRYNPITKRVFFMEKYEDKPLTWKYAQRVYTTEIAKAHYEDEYEYALDELDKLEKEAETGYEEPKIPIVQKGLKFVL